MKSIGNFFSKQSTLTERVIQQEKQIKSLERRLESRDRTIAELSSFLRRKQIRMDMKTKVRDINMDMLSKSTGTITLIGITIFFPYLLVCEKDMKLKGNLSKFIEDIKRLKEEKKTLNRKITASKLNKMFDLQETDLLLGGYELESVDPLEIEEGISISSENEI